jgi:hypothetical protein
MLIILGLGWWQRRRSSFTQDLLLLLSFGDGAHIEMLVKRHDGAGQTDEEERTRVADATMHPIL